MKVKPVLSVLLFSLLTGLILADLYDRWSMAARSDQPCVPYLSTKPAAPVPEKKKAVDYQKMVEAAGKIRH